MSEAPYHEWGSEFDFKALGEACDFFQKNLHRYARFNFAGCKEKYGTMRLEWVNCCHHGIYGLFKPGHLYMNKTYSKYFYTIDRFITALARKIGLSSLFWKYQILIFNIVTIAAVKKWPQIKYEIMDDLEFRRWLYNCTKKKVNYICHWVDVE